MIAVIVRHFYVKRIDDKEPQIPRIRSLADHPVYVLVVKTVTNDHHSSIRSQQVVPKLLMVPFQNRMLADG